MCKMIIRMLKGLFKHCVRDDNKNVKGIIRQIPCKDCNVRSQWHPQNIYFINNVEDFVDKRSNFISL